MTAGPRSERPFSGRGRLAGYAASCLFLVAGLLVFVPYAKAMATTSLWTDELRTILDFSGRGPLVTLTDYHEPNNHVFFNLVNSITPGRASVQPLRARLWSFLATVGFLGLAFGLFARRGAPEWGALLFCVLAIQPELLDLVLQARGYAFLCLFSLAASILAGALLEAVTPRRLAALGIVSVLGAWTVPTFAFFAGPLWVLLLAARRRRAVFRAAGATACGVVLAYAPLASQLVYHARHFGDVWGRQYAHVSAVGETLGTFLFRPVLDAVPHAARRPVALGLAVLLAVIALAAWRRDRRAAEPFLGVLGAAAAFFGACLLLRTPFIRTTAFIVVPIAFCAVSLLRILCAKCARMSGALMLVAALLVSSNELRVCRAFRFVPLEQWKEMADTLHDTFPRGTPFFVNANADFLAGYLAPGDALASGVDVGAVARGEEVYLDTPVVAPAAGRVDGRKALDNAVELRIPQRRAGYQAIWFVPPSKASVAAALAPGGDQRRVVTDRDLATGTAEGLPSLDVLLTAGHRYRSLVIVTGGGDREFTVAASTRVGRTRRWGTVTLVNLRDESVRAVRLLPARDSRGLPAVRELWAYADD